MARRLTVWVPEIVASAPELGFLLPDWSGARRDLDRLTLAHRPSPLHDTTSCMHSHGIPAYSRSPGPYGQVPAPTPPPQRSSWTVTLEQQTRVTVAELAALAVPPWCLVLGCDRSGATTGAEWTGVLTGFAWAGAREIATSTVPVIDDDATASLDRELLQHAEATGLLRPDQLATGHLRAAPTRRLLIARRSLPLGDVCRDTFSAPGSGGLTGEHRRGGSDEGAR